MPASLVKILPVVAAAGVNGSDSKALKLPGVGTKDFFSATAKSPNTVMPLACVEVAVRAPTVVVFQAAPFHVSISKLAVLAPASTSPATNLNIAAADAAPAPLVVLMPDVVSD